jgi:hypothetical protein
MDCAASLIGIKASDMENYRCPDCPGTSTHVLPQFACFVCEPCSIIHRNLGHFIRHQTEMLSEEDLALMSAGGNKALKEFFKYYNLENHKVSDKYRTRAAFFYKEMISKVAKDLKVDDFPDIHEGTSLVCNYDEVLSNEEDNKSCQGFFQINECKTNDELPEDSTEDGILLKLCRCFLRNGRNVARKAGWKLKDFKEIKETTSKPPKTFQSEILGTHCDKSKP